MSLVWNAIFRWPFGGESVFVTGTFTHWKNPIPLTKVGNEFNLILALPAGIHKYKFIVDGEWKFSLLEPTCIDESGNVNNILDTTHYNPRVSDNMSMGSGSTLDRKSGDTTSKGSIPKPNISKKQAEAKNTSMMLEELKSKNIYDEGLFNMEADITPPHLLDIYFINEKENKIREVWKKEEGKSDGSKVNTEGTFRAFEKYESISPPTHCILY